MTRTLFCLFFVLLGIQAAIAQNTSVKVVDSKSGESIPYANIKINESENLVSNSEGYFNVSGNNTDAAILAVSCMGYVNRQLTLGELKNLAYTIRLEPGAFALETVNVSNVKPDPDQIMAKVKENLARHYKNNGQPSKDMLFTREVHSLKPSKLDVEITKSTGFTKKGLKLVNADLKTFTAELISHPPQEFTDMLGNYYKAAKYDTPAHAPKLEVIKAIKLKDENRSTSIDDLEKTAGKLLFKHMDSTKYYRVKSGFFGSRDTISLRKDFDKKRNHINTSLIANTKSTLMSFIAKNTPLQSSKLNFINQPELYEYTYEGAIYSNENEFIYVLNFKPRKSKAKYTGKLYVTEADYAVVRADYTLEEGKTLSGFNLKFLLGVKTSENVSKGTLIYKPNPNGIGYHLHYASVEDGEYFYINRPLKFIELTDEDKDVLALDLKIETTMSDKTEFLNMSRSEITEAAFEKVKEIDFKYVLLKGYDPKIWKDYSAIEPLEEMKQFRIVE